ncbi:MAG: hypothetical protein M3Q57_06315 [Pseudomonadota bacterium]|nr:hypothetical protein [Pseudomonadota bacterium]
MARDIDPPLLTDLMRFKPNGWTPNAWAVEAGVSRTVWSDVRRHGNPSRRTLEKLLTAAGSSLAEFEALRIGAPPPSAAGKTSAALAETAPSWRAAPLAPIPLYSTVLAGKGGKLNSQIERTRIHAGVADRLQRPAGLVGDREAYALTVVGDSMWPRFRPGRLLLVSVQAPVAIGDDVVVRLRGVEEERDSSLALIKELVRRTAAFVELRQFTPDITFRVEASDLTAIHKVIGEYY